MSALRPMRHRLEYSLVMLATALFRAMGVDSASAFNGFLWQSVAPWTARHRRASQHLEAAMPALSASERVRILRRMWNMLGRVFAEGLLLDRLINDPGRLIIPADIAQRYLRRDAGPAVFVSLHAGNWELVTLALAQAGQDVAGVYQRLENPLVDEKVAAMRAPIYRAGLISKGKDAVFRLRRLLKTGQSVALLADQRTMRGVTVPFFHKGAPSTPMPAFLAITAGVPLIAGRIIRRNATLFELDAEEIPVARTGARDADILETTARIQAVFERWVREYPEQWMWAHRRWER